MPRSRSVSPQTLARKVSAKDVKIYARMFDKNPSRTKLQTLKRLAKDPFVWSIVTNVVLAGIVVHKYSKPKLQKMQNTVNEFYSTPEHAIPSGKVISTPEAKKIESELIKKYNITF